jgi:hypothetical protein
VLVLQFVCTRVGCRLSCVVIYAVATHLFFLSSYHILPAENDSDKFEIFDSLYLTFSRIADADSGRPKQPDFQLLLLLGQIIWRQTDRALTEKVGQGLIAFGLSS